MNTGYRQTSYGGSGGAGAPVQGTFITQLPDGTLTQEQALSTLATGLLKVTTGTGVLSTAVSGTDYVAPSRQVIAGTGLSGGGALSANVTLSLPNVGPGAGAIGGTSTLVRSVTLDAQGRVTAATTSDLGALASGVVQVTTTTGALTSFAPTATRVPFGGTGGGTLTESSKLVFDITDASNSYLKIGESAANASWIWMRGVAVALVDSGGISFGNITTADGHALFLWSNGVIRQTIGKGTVASAAGAVWDGFKFNTTTVTVSGATNITTATGFNSYTFSAPTVSAASALTVTNSATVYIAGPPTGGGAGPATLTHAAALVAAGDVGIGGFPTAFSPLEITKATVGAPTYVACRNTDNTNAASAAVMFSSVAGSSAGDPTFVVNVNGVTQYTLGIDNSVSGDPFVVSVSGGLGAGADAFSITTNKNVLMSGSGTLPADVASTTLKVIASKTVASGASAVWDALDFTASTLTLSGVTNITTATGVNFAVFRAPTFSNASIAVTSAATVYIDGSPAVTGGMSITRPYSLWVDSGVTRLDGATLIAASAAQVLLPTSLLDVRGNIGADALMRVVTGATNDHAAVIYLGEADNAGGSVAYDGATNTFSLRAYAGIDPATNAGSVRLAFDRDGVDLRLNPNAAGLIGMYGVTAVIQWATTGTATGFTAGAGTGVTHLSTFTGNLGTKAYTLGDVVQALKLIGIMAQN